MLRVFLICFSLVLSINALSQSTIKESGQQQNKQPAKSTTEKTTKNDSASYTLAPASVQPIPEPQGQSSDSQGNQHHKWYDTFLDHPTEWLLSLFNGLLVLYTYRLWTATNGLRESAEQTAERQLRAYVSVTGSERIDNPQFPGCLAFQAAYINSGQTPAYKLEGWIGTTFSEPSLKTKLPSPPDSLFLSKTALGPNCVGFIQITMDKALSAKQLQEIANGGKVVFVYGRFDYIDAFTHPRFTEYRLIWRGESIGGVGLKRHEDGNDAT